MCAYIYLINKCDVSNSDLFSVSLHSTYWLQSPAEHNYQLMRFCADIHVNIICLLVFSLTLRNSIQTQQRIVPSSPFMIDHVIAFSNLIPVYRSRIRLALSLCTHISAVLAWMVQNVCPTCKSHVPGNVSTSFPQPLFVAN